MTKSQLLEKLAERSNLTKQQASAALDSLVELVVEHANGKVLTRKPIRAVGPRRDFIVVYRPGLAALLAWRRKQVRIYVVLHGPDFSRRVRVRRDAIRTD